MFGDVAEGAHEALGILAGEVERREEPRVTPLSSGPYRLATTDTRNRDVNDPVGALWATLARRGLGRCLGSFLRPSGPGSSGGTARRPICLKARCGARRERCGSTLSRSFRSVASNCGSIGSLHTQPFARRAGPPLPARAHTRGASQRRRRGCGPSVRRENLRACGSAEDRPPG